MLISCKNCHKVYSKNDYKAFTCTRCNHKVTKRVKNSLQISMALCLCAIFLYIPAMTYPMMEITKVGVNVSSTIIEGIISFLEFENYFIALVIFVASVVIPLVKLFGLFIIFLTLSFKSKIDNTTKIKIYNYIKVIGKWSMVDIYVVALMASLIQLDEVFNIKAGIASMSFTLVVILTMIAAQKFDKRIIWDE